MLFYSNFNSIKVRLELNITDPTLYSDASFQFHKGTIRTPLLFLALVLCLDFNSIKVRLEPDVDEQIAKFFDISIP